MPTAFIQINNLHRKYCEGEQDFSVLKGADMSIQCGETVALLGRSGSGKSTLLNLISGIDHPDSGSVSVNNIELTRLSEQQRTLFRRQHIGFVYQFFNLIPTLTAAENIALILELNNYSARKIKQRVSHLLNEVGLEQRGNSFPDQLSGGEQQRVAIARALAHEPTLVLADEPTGNLDAEMGLRVLALLRQLVVANKGTLILVTHSLAVAKTADRILTLDDGKLAERVGDFAW